MISYATAFCLIALVGGILGFFILAGTAATIAKAVFFTFLVFFILSFLRGRKV